MEMATDRHNSSAFGGGKSQSMANANLKQAETFYRALFDYANDAIFLIDNDIFIDCNSKTLEIYGCSRGQIIGKSPHAPFSPELQSDGRNSKEKALEKITACLNGEPQIFEWLHRKFNGDLFDAEVSLNPVVLGNKTYIMAIVRDITERKNAEHALRESKRELSTLISNLPGFVYRCKNDKKWTMAFISDGCTALTGYAADDLKLNNRVSYNDTIHKDDRKSVWDSVQAAVKKDQPFQLIYRIITADKQIKWVWEQGRGIFDNMGNLLGLEGFITNITERVKTEQELKASESLLTTTFDSIHDGISIIDKDQNIIRTNSIMEKWFEPMMPLVGKKCYQAFHNSDVPCEPCPTMAYIKTGKIETETIQGLPGTDKIFEMTVCPIKTENGQIQSVIQLIQDVTERRKSDIAIREERDKAQRYLDVAAVMLMALDKTGKVTLINKKGCEILGYPEDQIIGKIWFEHFLPDCHKAHVKETFKQILAGTKKDVLENHINPILTKSGQEKLIHWHNSVIKDDYGNIVTILSSGEDITERIKTQNALKESEEQFRLFYEKSPLGYQSLDIDGNIFEVNPAWLDLLGYTKEEVIGKNFADFLSPSNKDLFKERFPHFKEKGSVRNIPFEFVRKDGKHIIVEIDGNIGHDEQGNFKQTHCVVRDVTEKKRAERELFHRQERLRALSSELAIAEEQERHRIAAGMHDDIGSKLALAKLELQSLMQTVSKESIKTSLEKQCDTLNSIIASVRSLTFELSDPILYEIGFEAALESWMMKNIVQPHGINCEFISEAKKLNLEERTKITLFKAAREILTNTAKHAQADHITVKVNKRGDLVDVMISDDGVGFDTAILADAATSTESFGLSYLRDRLEHLGGKLSIKSKPQKGTQVTMTVPQ